MTTRARFLVAGAIAVMALGSATGQGQQPVPGEPPRPLDVQTRAGRQQTAPVFGAGLSSEYRIGPEDVLDISVWRNTELTRTVAVRPDGKISLPLLNDIDAASLTPMQLRDILAKGYSSYVKDAEVSVIVREIHSLRVSVVGRVRTPGRYELGAPATVLEALAMAGGLTEFAKRDRIVVFRHDGKAWQRLGFDYDFAVSENAELNFVLRPGDIVVVP